MIGFSVDDALARELQEETGTHVTLLRSEAGGWQVFCSTLDAGALRELERGLPKRVPAGSEVLSLDIAGDDSSRGSRRSMAARAG